MRRALWRPPLLVVLLCPPTLRGGLVWDEPLFLHHPVYRAPVDWAGARGSPFVLSPNCFRPLPVASFLLTGAMPWLNHLVNALLHAPDTALVILLISRLRALGDGLAVLHLGGLAGYLGYLSDHPGLALFPLGTLRTPSGGNSLPAGTLAERATLVPRSLAQYAVRALFALAGGDWVAQEPPGRGLAPLGAEPHFQSHRLQTLPMNWMLPGLKALVGQLCLKAGGVAAGADISSRAQVRSGSRFCGMPRSCRARSSAALATRALAKSGTRQRSAS